MTLRLVALMSVVLLLSLGAFGLLTQHYQDQVMDEVGRTASEVGRATLRTLETRAGGTKAEQLNPRPGPVGMLAWAPDPRSPSVWSTAPGTGAKNGQGPDGAVAKKVESISAVGMGLVPLGVVGSEGDTAAVTVVCDSDHGLPAQEDCVATKGDATVEFENRFFVDIDDVHAESDPAQGMVLKIRTFKPESAEGADQVVMANAELPPGAHTFVFKRHEDIRLPIPVAEYDSLFASVRRRFLWVFLGVFVVGTALSAGVASRFTRPVRRLDAAIRRLSAGDLAVQVPARGNDEVARLGKAFNDMTRSLRANRQRSREMLRREKHSALGRLAAGVAHDVRNPLHSIGLTLEHLGDAARPESPERAAEFDRSMEIIRGEIRRLDQIVGNFLRFAKSDVRERGPINLGEVLNETVRLVRKEAEWRKVDLHLELGESVPVVGADGEALRSAILNLVLNSFEAMPAGGRLTLSVAPADGGAMLEVADTGEGIAEQDQDRVFDFAFTTKEGGSGLGLAMVYQCIVEDHGGRVTLDSVPQGGTRVCMFLPPGNESTVEIEA